MAPMQSPQDRSVPLLHFIIALIFVKAKPSGLSGQDFRKQLVSYIQAEPFSNGSRQADAHIDIATFWRHKYNELAEDNAALQARLSRLQARLSDLEERRSSGNPQGDEVDDSARSQSIKRKIDHDQAEGDSDRSTKRPRTEIDAVPLAEQDAVLQRFINYEARSEWDELGNNLLDSLRNLQRLSMATKGKPLRPELLARELRKIATDICRLMSAIDHTARFRRVARATSSALPIPNPRCNEQIATHPQTEPGASVEDRLIVIRRIVPHFLAHLHALSELPESEILCGKVINEVINIFRVLFQRIRDLAVADAKSGEGTPKTRKKQTNGREEPDATSSCHKRPATSPFIMKICRLVTAMLFHLDTAKSSHKAILEGCFYLLMTRVGKVLRDFTIGERPFGVQGKDATSRLDPYHQEERQDINTAEASDTEASGASNAQAPYLIWILDHAPRSSASMNLASNATTTSYDDGRQTKVTPPDGSCITMYDDARLRLQRTLVRAVFGDVVAASFQPALEPPAVLPDDEVATDFEVPTETADVRDWFTNEVWRLVGWDVLRGNMEWGPNA